MVLFDIANFFKENTERYKAEVTEAKSMQDNMKKFNEQITEEKLLENKLISLLEGMQGDIMSNTTSVSQSQSGVGEFSGNTDKEKVWNFFRSKGFTKKATAGIMGNTEQESSTNPKTIQNGGRGPGTGLIQWGNNADGGRWNSLEKWASKEGKDKWAIETQLEWLWKEMNDSYHTTLLRRRLGDYGYAITGSVLDTYAKVDNIKDSVYIFDRAITRAGKPMFERRLNYANKIYEEFKNYTGGSSSGTGQLVNPAPGRITSKYGMRRHPVYGDRRMHKGIDVAGGGRDLVAVDNGTVTLSRFDKGFGWYMKINHGNIGGKKVESLYAHMASQSPIAVGQSVTKGQTVGTMGTTGTSTGIHLHFEIHENGSTVDPQKYVSY